MASYHLSQGKHVCPTSPTHALTNRSPQNKVLMWLPCPYKTLCRKRYGFCVWDLMTPQNSGQALSSLRTRVPRSRLCGDIFIFCQHLFFLFYSNQNGYFCDINKHRYSKLLEAICFPLNFRVYVSHFIYISHPQQGSSHIDNVSLRILTHKT